MNLVERILAVADAFDDGNVFVDRSVASRRLARILRAEDSRVGRLATGKV